jgi:hypothetical protein
MWATVDTTKNLQETWMTEVSDQTIQLKCPVCKKKLRDADRMEHATLCLKRTCRCGTKWSLIITPMFTKKSDTGELVFATHYLKWTCLAGTPVP